MFTERVDPTQFSAPEIEVRSNKRLVLHAVQVRLKPCPEPTVRRFALTETEGSEVGPLIVFFKLMNQVSFRLECWWFRFTLNLMTKCEMSAMKETVQNNGDKEAPPHPRLPSPLPFFFLLSHISGTIPFLLTVIVMSGSVGSSLNRW